MKSPGTAAASAAPAGKRRWRCVAAAGAAVALAFFSVVVPLAVLLGLHARFPSMYMVDESAVSVYDGSEGGSWEPIPPEENGTLQVNSTVKEFVPPTPKEWTNTNGSQPDTVIAPPIQQATVLEDSSSLNFTGTDLKDSFEQGLPGDENEKSCQLQFGSYCLWSVEHEEVMKDFIVKQLKDQLFVARAYYPSIVKLDGMEKLSHEMKQNIQEHGHMLSEAISDADLPELLGVQTLPKSLHCLSMRLTVDYFNALADMEHSDAEKFGNPAFQHYVIFSTNLLAASMTINSSVINSEESANMVFHLMTDGQNFYAFKNWFIRNSYKGATIRVLNFEDFQVKNLGNGIVDQLSSSEEFRITSNSNAVTLNTLMRTEYISMFGHSLFLLPELFTNLKRVIVLEDDTIVQRDLSLLWNLDLKGKVIGAVQFCRVKFRQLRAYLPNFPYNSSSCIWMSGVSVIDLNEWREHDVTGIHHRILEKLRHDTEASWRSAALPAGLLAFENLIHPIEDQWVQFGLGHDYGLTHGAIKKAAILHYNGNMKPWLELGIHRYRKYWKRYLPRDDVFMMDCNVNP
ncbi:hypothetical protein PAHAL_3G236700 [Panicum hallii]|uniref:Hexosyltransferase n=1 Tax=Panicum hallii TaxID=206008 RepID=A0A2S3HB18_9POAL|nr:hypothetical protein PAHAL_3G236700 [Panicum hallii]